MCLFQTWVSSLPRALRIQSSTSVLTGVAHGTAHWHVPRALAPAPCSCPYISCSARPPRSTQGSRPESLPQLLRSTWPLTQALPSCTPAREDLSQRPSLDHDRNTEQAWGVMAAQPCVPRQNCPEFIAPLGSLHLTFPVRSHLAAIASSQDPLPA